MDCNGAKMELRIIGRSWIPGASKIWSYGFHLRKSEKKVEVEIDGEQAERVLQMVRVLGSLLVTKLLSNVQRGENED